MNKKTALIAAAFIGIIIIIALISTSTDGRTPGMLAAQSGAGDCVELYINGVLVYPDVSCMPPEPTETAEPTETPEPPTPTPEPTHDVTSWHSPADGHHHGADPDTSNLWAGFVSATGQEIAYPWLSSPTENMFPYPTGKHEGFKFLLESGLDCEQFNTAGNLNCITDYLIEIHSIGDHNAILTRVHSQFGGFRVCTPDLSQCGLVYTGGHADGGVLHNGYKTDICELSSDPPNYPYDTTQGQHQVPYRTGHRTTLNELSNNPQFWNTLGPNFIFEQYYPHLPNRILQLAWTGVDAWSYINGEPALCSSPDEAEYICPDGSCDFNHSRFQVFTIRLLDLPDERPFNGFTDVNGHIDDSCTEASAECIPLVIGADVPAGDAVLNRPVQQGNCDNAPCQEFDDGTPLYAPGYVE